MKLIEKVGLVYRDISIAAQFESDRRMGTGVCTAVFEVPTATGETCEYKYTTNASLMNLEIALIKTINTAKNMLDEILSDKEMAHS